MGIVDPFAQASRVYELIRARGIPVYQTIDDFYADHQVPLAVVSTPISRHALDAERCFAHGSHVLL